MFSNLTPSILMPAFAVIKKKQVLLLWGCLGFLVLVVMGLVKVIMTQTSMVKPALSYKVPLTTGSRRVDRKEVWMEKITADQNLQGKEIENIRKLVEAFFKINMPRAEFSDTDPSFPPVLSQPSTLTPDLAQTEAASLQGTALPNPSVLPSAPVNAEEGVPLHSPSHLPVQVPVSVSPKKAFRSKGIQKVSLQLQNPRGHKALKTTDNTIPAGAFAQAVLVGGVDASTSIQASSDPRPVLLRITNKGTLPRRFKSDLCGCHALAACYGDISSERVYMRLEKITCTERKTGELLEMSVQGYIAGEDGRAGLRGRVVDRAGESMRNAAVGGFLSGIGSFLSQSHNPVTFSPLSGLAQTNPLTNGELLKQGATKGVTGALERYADFYIKRAEQMQPVIQVQAGRLVDIVFTQGTAFGDSAVRGALVRTNDQHRYQQINDTQAEEAPKAAEAWISPQGETK